MSRDADATRARLLSAAIGEFAAAGRAGARVDAIAAAARANKRAIYDYFGSKEALFTLAVQTVARELVQAVPLDADDLPGYAGRLFDHLIEHPETARLIGWRRLEGPQDAGLTSPEFYDQLAQVRDDAHPVTQRIGTVDLIILVIGLANAWDLSGREITAPSGQAASASERLAEHRAAVVEATRRLCE